MNYQEQLAASRAKRERQAENAAALIAHLVARACATLCIERGILTHEQAKAIVSETMQLAAEHFKKEL